MRSTRVFGLARIHGAHVAFHLLAAVFHIIPEAHLHWITARVRGGIPANLMASVSISELVAEVLEVAVPATSSTARGRSAPTLVHGA